MILLAIGIIAVIALFLYLAYRIGFDDGYEAECDIHDEIMAQAESIIDQLKAKISAMEQETGEMR